MQIFATQEERREYEEEYKKLTEAIRELTPDNS